MPKFDTTPEELLVALCSGDYNHAVGILEAQDEEGNPAGNCCLGVYCHIAGVPFAPSDAILWFTPLDDVRLWDNPNARLPEDHWLNGVVRRAGQDGLGIYYDGGLDSILTHHNDQREDVGYDLVIQVLCYYLADEPIPMELEPLVPVNR